MPVDIGFSYQENQLTIYFQGDLSQKNITTLWKSIEEKLALYQPQALHLDFADLTSYSLNSLSIIIKLLIEPPCPIKLINISTKLKQDIDLFQNKNIHYHKELAKHPLPSNEIRFSWTNILALPQYQIKILMLLFKSLPKFKRLHWEELLYFFEIAGIQALAIIILLGLLLGIILTLQSLTALQQFGMGIFSIHLVGLSVSQELAPLLTATLMSSRSGAAFAAELASMRHNQEIDALLTMNISPQQLLVLPRTLAIILLTPFMILFMLCAAVIGSALLLFSFGYSFELYQQYLIQALHFNDILLGFSKGFIFGFLIATISCFYGLNPKTQIGQAATYSVVSSLMMIIFTDSIIGGLIYLL